MLQLGNSLALRSSTSVSCLADGTLDLNGQTIGSAVPLDDFAGILTNSSDTAATFDGTVNATTQDSFIVAGTGNITLAAAVYGSSTTWLTTAGSNTVMLADTSQTNGLSLAVGGGLLEIAAGGNYSCLALEGGNLTMLPSGTIPTITTLDWDPGHTGATTGPSGGDGTWDTSSLDWYNPATGDDQAWSNSGEETAIFSGAGGAVALATDMSADAVAFQSDGYLLDGSSLTVGAEGISVSATDTATIDSTFEGDIGLVKIGTGTLVAGGTNSYTGPTLILYGTLALANSAALGDSSVLGSHPSATLDLNGQSIDDTVPLFDFQGTITNSSSTAASLAAPINYNPFVPLATGFTVSGTGEITLSGPVDEYGSVLTKTGTSTLVLSGSDDNVGLNLVVDSGTVDLDKSSSSSVHAVQAALTINGGTVQATGTGGDQIANAAPVEMTDGILDLNGENETVGSLSGSGGVITNTLASSTSTLTVGAGDADGAFAGSIQDTGTGGGVDLIKEGAGTQILDGENTYSGGTTIDAGTLQLGDGLTSNGSVIGNIADDGSLVFDGVYVSAYAGAISGTGSLTQDGFSTTTLTGANTYSGATNVNFGALILGVGGSLGNTAISVADGAAFDPQPGSGAIAAGDTGSGSGGAKLTLAAGSTIDMTDGSAGAFDLQQESSFSGTTLSIDDATLNFDLSSSAADELATTLAASVSGDNTINITGLSAGLTAEQTFTLISAASGLSGTFDFANGTNTESLFEDDETYTLELNNSGTAETLTVTALPNYAVFINGTFVDGSTTFDLGTAYANEPTIASVVIENTGTRTLTLSDPITLPTGFTLAADYGTLVLAAGQSTTFAMRLDSSLEGSLSGTLSIASDDPVEATFDVTISGEVVARAAGVDDQNFSASGDGWTTVSNSGAVGGQELTAPSGTGENTTSWVFNDLDPTLEYQVFATWTAASGQATNATYTILDGSNAEGPADGNGDTPNAPFVVGTLGTVAVDQTVAPSDATVGGIAWASLGSFTATSGVIEVDLSDDANGVVVAGGARIVAVHVKEPPVLTPINDQSTTAGDDLSIQLSATDPDVSSGLSYSLLNTAPPGMSINSSTGLITWDTTNVFAGTYTITAQVSDGGTPALTATEMFSIAVANTSTPSGSGGDVVSVYSTADANEGGSAGDIRLVRTGDLTTSLTVLYQIDESESGAAQFGSCLEYVGPDVGSPIDGILYGSVSFAAGAATTDISIDASADTDNADNPTVSFELLPDNFTIPGDVSPDTLVEGGYTVGSSGTAAPAIRSSLEVAGGTAFVGLQELAADHRVIAKIKDSKEPPGAKIAYTLTGGNDEGMFTLTSDGKILLATGKDAAIATGTTYSLQIVGIGTFADGTQTNVSKATETITIGPSVGVYGDTMATRGTNDTIELTFIRFAKNLTASLTVNFTVQWGSATSADLKSGEGDYAALMAGKITILAGDPSVTMTLYAALPSDGEPVVGIRTFSIYVQQSTDANATYKPDGANTHLQDRNADTVLPNEDLYILDAVTAFATVNANDKLNDPTPTPENPGINPNDIVQNGLGDCYFVTAEMALAQFDPQAIQNLITENSDGSFTVKLYDDPAKNWLGDGITGWRTFTISINILSNGWSMAGLSGDYNSITGAVEIWPQLLEAAWMQMAGQGSYLAIFGGSTANALVAMTGQPYTFIPLAGMTNQQIGHALQQEVASGGPVAIGTIQDTFGKKGALPLTKGNVYFDHAYVVESVDTDGSGNVTGVVLRNPWGWASGDDYEIDVPIADFSAVFAYIFCIPSP